MFSHAQADQVGDDRHKGHSRFVKPQIYVTHVRVWILDPLHLDPAEKERKATHPGAVSPCHCPHHCNGDLVGHICG